MKFLFAVHDWGLGHATRDLVLIRALLTAGHSVTIISAGRALRLLRDELQSQCEYIELRDIPKPLSRRAAAFYVKMSLSLPWVFDTFRRENKTVETLCRTQGFDRIISDSRFGVCHCDVPSFYLFHSLRQIIPGRPRQLEKLVEVSQRRLLTRGQRILIPDQETHGLAGDLCHDMACSWQDRLAYIGIISSVQRQRHDEDIDYFISVSGAEPQRSIFEKLVLTQAQQLKGRVVIALGRPDLTPHVSDDGRIAIHSFMNREQQQQMMNRAQLIVTRSGYTTLMELAELGKKALLIPTVGQSEQEYLADYHRRLGHLYSVTQSQLQLARDVAIAATYNGLPPQQSTAESVQRFLSLVVDTPLKLTA